MSYLIRQERALQMQARVGRGADWLDRQVFTYGWRSKINLRNFDMTNPCRCVLGQVFGNYWDAVNEVAPQDERSSDALDDYNDVYAWEVDRGFNLPAGEDDDADWDALERAWVNYLRDDASWSRAGARVSD